jgi:hypothetical protein
MDDEAIQNISIEELDCFVAALLAMTREFPEGASEFVASVCLFPVVRQRWTR